MFLLQRFHLDKVIRLALRAPRWTGEHPFFGFLILLLLVTLISSAVFYQTVLATRDTNGEGEVLQIRVDQRAFQGVLQVWKERGERFGEAGSVQIRNIFVPIQASEEAASPEEEG